MKNQTKIRYLILIFYNTKGGKKQISKMEEKIKLKKSKIIKTTQDWMNSLRIPKWNEASCKN